MPRPLIIRPMQVSGKAFFGLCIELHRIHDLLGSSIDNDHIVQSVIDIVDGGREAFRARQQRYGLECPSEMVDEVNQARRN